MSYQRRAVLIHYSEDAGHSHDSYVQQAAGESDTRQRIMLAAVHYRPSAPSDTVIVFMHPMHGLAHHPLVEHLAAAGHHVLCCPSRYSSDSSLIMEKVVSDLGGCVRHLKDELGYRRVVLAGWSGGGALMAFYQSQAEDPTVVDTPAGDPYNLVRAGLIPADGIMFIAAHASRHQLLTESLDPAVVDERDPSVRDPRWDLYATDALTRPPYSASFIASYRAAQIDRNRRITTWVRATLRHLRESGRQDEEYAFTVHGTMADPRWLDPSVDPNERRANWCYQGDPRVVNNGPTGLARFSTLRSWLSQWSYDESMADGPARAAEISVPVLVIAMGADDACPPSHPRALFDAVPHDDKEFHVIPGVNHYIQGTPDGLPRTRALCQNWLKAHDLG